MKLGKQPPKFDPRTLLLGNYIDHAVWQDVTVPTKVVETPAISSRAWPMLGNDKYGDCVEAAGLHVAELVAAMHNKNFTPTDQMALADYHNVTGFSPNDPNTDQGTIMLDYLKYWRTHGIGDGSQKILGFVGFNPRSHTEWKAANYLFGNTFVGIALPATAENQVGSQDTEGEWKVTTTQGDGQPGSWGGHCVPGFDFDYQKVNLLTWARRQYATWSFIGTYCDESYVVFTNDWVDAVTQKAPNGFDYNRLLSELGKFS